MAVTPLRDQVARLVSAELNPTRRYRCLILQADRLDVLSRLCEYLPSALADAGRASRVLPWEGFFDQVGAMAADSARACINEAGKTDAVVLAGPLHFVDYWTPGVQEGFWNFLSLYSRGPGIVVVDIPRTEGVEGPFVARGVIPGTDIRFLRPRLVATEETYS
ncbi:hypothetical protein J8F10_08730 [Gemmata sp. G18]|uniref:Uncharacterized protein n=1 Tax=Gemmata palustris TaxID=2822762 RepID=A0ABS5BR61_9BACT|nr:hypothetical protein [Gemmata palustris]MBP3955363.1 hypothetical protein [Gemmata palustris]